MGRLHYWVSPAKRYKDYNGLCWIYYYIVSFQRVRLYVIQIYVTGCHSSSGTRPPAFLVYFPVNFILGAILMILRFEALYILTQIAWLVCKLINLIKTAHTGLFSAFIYLIKKTSIKSFALGETGNQMKSKKETKVLCNMTYNSVVTFSFTPTSFLGSFISPAEGAREKRPWFRLLPCLCDTWSSLGNSSGISVYIFLKLW